MEPMTREQIIISVVSTILGSGVLNGIITHILYNRKLKKEQSAKFQNMLGEQIADALEKAYELADKIKATEKYQAYEQMTEGTFDAFDMSTTYPAIMTNPDTLNTFMAEVSDFRRKTERLLDSRLTLDLVYLERYIYQLNVFTSGFGSLVLFPIIGMAIETDLDNWYKSFVKKIVKNLNKTKCKTECHFGKRWMRLRKKLVEERWENSDLYKIMNNSFEKKDNPNLKRFSKLLQQIKENKVKILQ